MGREIGLDVNPLTGGSHESFLKKASVYSFIKKPPNPFREGLVIDSYCAHVKLKSFQSMCSGFVAQGS